MKQFLILASALLLLFIQCSSPVKEKKESRNLDKQLPRALFISSGIGNNNVLLAKGVVVALQTLNSRGVPVRIETREILYDYEQLSQYNILILSTFPGYHDADRKYSLSYMSDQELQNLNNFVKNGGVMIAGDNVGRNLADGTDRITMFKTLTTDNWKLSECFGVNLSERNMTGFNIGGEVPGYFQWDNTAKSLTPEGAEKWTLVADSVFSNGVEVLGFWQNGTDSVPALIRNNYEKGVSYLLPSSGFLHPVNDGGYWSEKQIESFYNYVLDEFNNTNNINLSVNPWPSGYDYAFCVTLNSQGTVEQYKRVFKVLKKEEVKPTIFVNGLLTKEVISFLRSSTYPLASGGYSFRNFQDMGYPESLSDILRNENEWGEDFSGFRFPYTRPSFWGIMALDKNDYLFESSIGANNLEFIHGSVFPYNIVISNNGYFKSTDILEIAPTYHDDYHFLKEILGGQKISPFQLEKDTRIYTRYLKNYWKYAIQPYRGLMVYLGHPQYVGYNDTTVTSLTNLIKTVKQDNVWITTINELAEFRNGLSGLQFLYKNTKNGQLIKIAAPDGKAVKNVCLNLNKKYESIKVLKGNLDLINGMDKTRIVFDAFDGQEITITY